MSKPFVLRMVCHHLQNGGHLRLFLDYDGTLVPIARTPLEALPDSALIDLLTDLAQIPTIETTILSGRTLYSLQAMLPIPRLTLAGLYGMEIQRDGMIVMRGAASDAIRPVITQVRTEWKRLIHERGGFLLEDKGLAIALHTQCAEQAEADTVLSAARTIAADLIGANHFQLLEGRSFLEVAPVAANKGQAVNWFLKETRALFALPIYFGDDDKDEAAFPAVRSWGGLPIAVGTRYTLAGAVERVPCPDAVREWLRAFIIAARQANTCGLCFTLPNS